MLCNRASLVAQMVKRLPTMRETRVRSLGQEDPLEEEMQATSVFLGASLMVQTVKHLPTMRETRVRSLSQEVPLEKEMATHSSILARKIPWTFSPWVAKRRT